MVQPFPKDMLDSMRDCILAIFWPKDDILDFFRSNGCTPDVLKVAVQKKSELSRAKLIDQVFLTLNLRPDGAIGQYRAMLKTLIEWNSFDPYYFRTLHKLEEEEARRCINHLKQLQEIRDARIVSEREKIAKRQQVAVKQAKGQQIKDLRDAFLSLYQERSALSHQQRGYAFEGLLGKLAAFAGLMVTDSFKILGEQIDGAIKFDGEHYVIEAKWQDRLTASNALYHFAHKVEGKMYGRGLFISINGFEPTAIQALVLGKSIRTILVDGGDLTMVLEERISFVELLDAKVKSAQTKGWIYVDSLTGDAKY